MKRIFATLLLLTLAPALAAQEKGGGHFYFAGPLDRLTADGVKVAPVSSGLPFSLLLSEAGAKIEPAQFDLKIPGAATPLRLMFESLKFAAGRLTGSARVVNASGSAVEGVRLDIVSATEEFQTKDAKGAPTLSTRAQRVSLSSPLFFGDLAAGESSDPVAFEVSAIKLAPETTRVTLAGVVSGLRLADTFSIPEVNNPVQIDTDAQGRLYVCDGGGQRVVRAGADGRGAETLAKLEDQCISVAVAPKTGDVYVTRGNSTDVYVFSNSGAPKGSFDGGDYLSFLRFDRQGNLYASGGHVFRFAGRKVELDLKEAFGEGLSAKGIDIDAAGRIWAVSGLEDERTFFRVGPDGREALRVSAGKDWRLGRLDIPESVRVDAAGNVYVAELGEEGVEAARVSVFDREGAFVRAFGRGGRAPDPDTDKLLTGQVWRPKDIAFGPDGRVYVAQENDGGFKTNAVLVFLPF